MRTDTVFELDPIDIQWRMARYDSGADADDPNHDYLKGFMRGHPLYPHVIHFTWTPGEGFHDMPERSFSNRKNNELAGIAKAQFDILRADFIAKHGDIDASNKEELSA